MSNNGEIMDIDSNDINSSIVKNILTNNLHGISDIRDVKNINSFYLTPDHYKVVERLIRAGKIDEIEQLPANSSDSLQYYYVITFKDQSNSNYAVTVYDSNELWQDPQLIEVFPL